MASELLGRGRESLTARRPGPTREYSRALPALRLALAGLAALGGALLVAAELTSLIAVRDDGGQLITRVSGGSHHGYALAVVGLAAVALAAALARRESRPVLLALAALGLIAAIIELVGDLPDVRASGLVGSPPQAGRASPAVGFYLETLGAVLVILAAGARLMVADSQAPADRVVRRSAPARVREFRARRALSKRRT